MSDVSRNYLETVVKNTKAPRKDRIAAAKALEIMEHRAAKAQGGQLIELDRAALIAEIKRVGALLGSKLL